VRERWNYEKEGLEWGKVGLREEGLREGRGGTTKRRGERGERWDYKNEG
jgi:hypothetical protein